MCPRAASPYVCHRCDHDPFSLDIDVKGSRDGLASVSVSQVRNAVVASRVEAPGAVGFYPETVPGIRRNIVPRQVAASATRHSTRMAPEPRYRMAAGRRYSSG
jgi:hypothetical protein